MFIALQIDDLKTMFISFIFFLSLFVILPTLFKFFFKFISPYAPHSEVPFLVVLSLISGVISKELGAYYLVGAFVVGLVGSRFKKDIFKDDEEVIFKALSSFFTVFLPFYFFYAGVKLNLSEFTMEAIALGLLFLVIFVPLRLILNATSITYFMKDWKKKPYDISLSLMPTLIFGLVIAAVLKEEGVVDTKVVYALIFYTLVASLLPTIFFSLQKRVLEEEQGEFEFTREDEGVEPSGDPEKVEYDEDIQKED
jgi:Kef-type K+ transport system membrane component KefB